MTQVCIYTYSMTGTSLYTYSIIQTIHLKLNIDQVSIQGRWAGAAASYIDCSVLVVPAKVWHPVRVDMRIAASPYCHA